MFIVMFSTESGDDYLLGPFETLPSHEEVLSHLPIGEQEFINEYGEDLYGDVIFRALCLPESAGIINHGERFPCKKNWR